MPKVIEQITINTNNNSFENIKEFDSFVEQFSIMPLVTNIHVEWLKSGKFISKISQVSPTCFQHIRTFQTQELFDEFHQLNPLTEINAFISTLQWTRESVISYEYD